MSDLGYSNNTQARINISLNSLDEYIRDLTTAIATPEPRFEKIGTRVDGQYRQLSVNRLQIENEYYSPVRPKRVAMSGERPTAALLRGGVEYVEIRSLDINAFDPVGINQNAMRFIEAFLIYCLLEESPVFDDAAYDELASNQSLTATAGRDPQLELSRDGQASRLTDWAAEILRNVAAVAEILDAGDDSAHYRIAVAAQAQLVEDSSLTPSARILKDLQDLNLSFFAYGLQAARNHKAYFAELEPLSGPRLEILDTEARESLSRQAAIEAADSISFDEYLAQYYAG
jgi:glutamate--cysteine ligase